MYKPLEDISQKDGYLKYVYTVLKKADKEVNMRTKQKNSNNKENSDHLSDYV